MAAHTAYTDAEKLAEEVKRAIGSRIPGAEASAMDKVLDFYLATIRDLDGRLRVLEERVGHISEPIKPVGEDGPALRG